MINNENYAAVLDALGAKIREQGDTITLQRYRIETLENLLKEATKAAEQKGENK